MSEKKFNLKTYQKINGNEHIDMRLNDTRGKIPDVINEKQLESYRATEANVIIEKLLDNKRTGEETEITEKRLDSHKPKFANQYRNPKTYDGDMNKLEEQRLSGNPVEDEKYSSSSSVGKKMRWWEDVKSDDGLKVSKTIEKKTVTAQSQEKEPEEKEPEEKIEEMKFDKPRWEEIEEEEEDTKATVPPSSIEDFEITDRGVKSKASKEMVIKKEKYLPNPNKPYLSGVYMVLSYDPDAFGGKEEEIKNAAMEKVLLFKPEFAGLISTDDFMVTSDEAGEGIVKLRAVGSDFAPVVERLRSSPTETPVDPEVAELPEEVQPIREISFQEIDLEGTPMSVGRVKIDEPITEENKSEVLNKIVDFVKSKHPRLEIDIDSLDTKDIESGEIRFMVATPILPGSISPGFIYNELLSPEENAKIKREMEMTADQILDEELKELEQSEAMPDETKEDFSVDDDIADEDKEHFWFDSDDPIEDFIGPEDIDEEEPENLEEKNKVTSSVEKQSGLMSVSKKN